MKTSIDIVIPVYNEEKDLPKCILSLREFMSERMPDYRWRIVVADNGSTDSTLSVAQLLSKKYPQVTHIHLDLKGRGRALRQAWLQSDADIVSYMDVDLSTDLNAFPLLVRAVQEGHDVAIGSRLKRGAQVRRSFSRETISRCYNLLIRSMFFTGFQDAQCGFKAMSHTAARELLPLVKDNGWFFDTELLLIAAKRGYRIAEIPVTWMEDPDTRVKVVRTAMGDIKGLLRLRFGGIPHPQRSDQKSATRTR